MVHVNLVTPLAAYLVYQNEVPKSFVDADDLVYAIRSTARPMLLNRLQAGQCTWLDKTLRAAMSDIVIKSPTVRPTSGWWWNYMLRLCGLWCNLQSARITFLLLLILLSLQQSCKGLCESIVDLAGVRAALHVV